MPKAPRTKQPKAKPKSLPAKPAFGLGHAALTQRQRAERHTHSPSTTLRVHRALSWLARAEVERNDEDARFIFLWIAFNSTYATGNNAPDMTERRSFYRFISTLDQLDGNKLMAQLVWNEFPSDIRVLLANPYVFADFWLFQTGRISEQQWLDSFKKTRRKAETALAAADTVTVLWIVLTRLYVLRNQLLHGGATWGGKVNRAQVRSCASMIC